MPPPTVLLVITRGEPGGAQVHVLELVTGLVGNVAFEVVIGDDEFLAQELRALGVPVHVLPELQRSISPATDLRALRTLIRIIRRVRPDLVHTHSTKAGVLGRLAAAAARVPSLHTAHAWSFSDGIPWSRKSFAIPTEALIGRITTRFIVVSEADREVAARFHVTRPAQVRVIHNGVRDVPQRAAPDAPGRVDLTMVARMATPKDHALLLRALVGIEGDFCLQFVGDGPDRAAIEALAGELGVAGRIAFLGKRLDVADVLAASHVGVLISKQEGFPLVVLEAMRAGLPVLASDVGGIREAVEDQHTGLLVARGDEAGLRRALRRLIQDPPLRRRLGDAGRSAFLARFTAAEMATQTAAVYRDLARGP